MRMDALAAALADLKRARHPAEIHLHHPDGAEPDRHDHAARRGARKCCGCREQYGVPIFEDDCYADLIWDGERPPALYAMSEHGGVIHIGSFSKSIAPALRVGFIVAPWEMMSRMLRAEDRRRFRRTGADGAGGISARRISPRMCRS